MGAGQAPPDALEGGQGSKGGEEGRERADPSDESIGTAAAAAPTLEEGGEEGPQGEEQKEDTILFIGDLARGLTEEDLEQAFSIVGKVCVPINFQIQPPTCPDISAPCNHRAPRPCPRTGR